MTKWQQELRWMRHVIARGDHEMRLDRWLRQQFPLAPQSLLQAQLRKRKIRLVAPPPADQALVPNSQSRVTTLSSSEAKAVPVPGKASSVLMEGFTVAIDAHLFQHTLQHAVTPPGTKQQQTSKLVPKPLLPELLQRIVYRDANYFVLDKPHGLAVQEGTGLETSLNDYLSALARSFTRSKSGTKADSDTNNTLRLVHRLDKETSGLLVLARSRLAAARFTELLQSGQVRKTYQALVAAPPKRKRAFEAQLARFQGEITSPVDGKSATTLVKTLTTGGGTGTNSNTTEDPRGVWLELSPVTGRKHQLRVHCAQVLHAPIVGDTKYRGPKAGRLYLHAQRIEFPDPFGSETPRDQGSQQDCRPGAKVIDIRRSIGYEYNPSEAK